MNWPMGKVSDIAEIISGFAFKSEWFGAGDAKVIRIGDLKNGRIDLSEAMVFDEKVHKVREQYRVKSGDILMALSGATVGKIAVADLEAEGAYLNQRVAIIRGKCYENSGFLKYIFTGSRLQKLLLNAGGAAQPNLSPKNLAEMEIPLPPLTEQKRIATILNKADNIRQKREQAIKLADDFLQTTFHKKFSNQTYLLNGWELKELKDIASIQTGPFGTQLHKEDYVENGIPLINPINIKNGIITPNFKLCVERQKYERLKEYHLKKGDIIMGRRGEMGRCALVNDKEDGWFCGTGSLFIRLNTPNEIVSFYLNEYLSSESIKNFLIKESRGVTMANLNKDIVGKIKVIIPPENVLTSFMKIKLKVEGIKEKITHSDLESLLSSLSKKYVQIQNLL
ncbi:restriction endonuclease subunit S [Salmonella enterica]|nr:restriction endonuclease subunit S [Salmonella enterica]EMD8372789.1 restriction endonuclease subunit S [Salmonella enterica]